MASRFVEIKDWDTACTYAKAGLLIRDDGESGVFWMHGSVGTWGHRQGIYGSLVEDDEDESASN